jgi:hypothetical protein
MNELSAFELGWLVGLLEGEGCFSIPPRVAVEMTDEDSVNKVAALFERVTGRTCNVHCKGPWGNTVQDIYYVRVNGEAAKKVMLLVVKYMSWRRRRRIWQVLNGVKEVTKKLDLVELGLIKGAA